MCGIWSANMKKTDPQRYAEHVDRNNDLLKKGTVGALKMLGTFLKK
jgi:hypothetical protein